MQPTKGTLARVLAAWQARARRPVDETTAWACLLANILLWPGLGGAALRELSGAIQMLLSLLSGVFVIVCGVRIVTALVTETAADLDALVRGMLAGLGVFAPIWLWALWTGARFVREAKR